jgi:pimeloyl-ACP methyl ester carboxylesterase
MKAAFALLVTLTSFCGCMSKYVFTLSEKQVTERYASKTIKPQFGHIHEKGGDKIFYALQGDASKPLLVLVHGAPGRWYSSINLFDDSLLLSHYQILAFDRPGYGKSGSGHSVTSIEEQTEHLAVLIRHFNPTQQPVTVTGHSYGTAIAACYAMLYPDRVQKLILLGSCIDPAKEKYFWFSYANKLGVIQHFIPKPFNMATDEKFTHRKELKKIMPGWENIKCPTFVVHGKKDWIADTANAWFAYQKIVNAPVSVYLLPESGHNITFSNPQLVRELIMGDGVVISGGAAKSIEPAKR